MANLREPELVEAVKGSIKRQSSDEWWANLHCPACKHQRHDGPCPGLRYLPCLCHKGEKADVPSL